MNVSPSLHYTRPSTPLNYYAVLLVNIIGSKCPGISRTVPDLEALSWILEGPLTSLLFVPDLAVLTCHYVHTLWLPIQLAKCTLAK